MPFVRAKRIKGIEYFYLVEGVWENGKCRQRVIAYLGKHSSVKAAHRYWTKQVNAGEDSATRKHAREMTRKLAQYL